MNSLTSVIKRYPQAAFWIIACSTFFFGYFMSIQTQNDAWQFLILATFLGGAFVAGVADGRSGLKTYLGRIVRWRVHIKWYAVAIFLPLALRLAAFGLTIALGAETVVNPTWNWGEIAFEAILVFLVIALGEEPAFRGFALVKLMKGNNALKASLILAVLHTIWHIPTFISGENPPMVILIIFAGAIINTWLFNKTNGSVLLNMIMHTSVNLWVGVFNPLFSEADAARQTTILMVAYIALAVVLTWLSGANLGRKENIESSVMTAEPQLAAN
jgi:membrane protease YdiL (CAAX protease family)